MAYVICDGPSHLGGVEFTPLHSKTPDIALGWVQNQSGWHKSIFQDTTTILSHIEPRWIPSLRAYLSEYNLHLELNYMGVYPIQHINDRHIMTMVVQSNEFTPIEIKKINCCREYLGVTTMADITLVDGCTLDPHMRSDNILLFSSTTTLLKAKQQRPNHTGWKLWSRCLKRFANHDQLWLPLIQWLQHTPTLKHKWP
eukprot:884514-Ditylum_brightwellii.AAC.1